MILKKYLIANIWTDIAIAAWFVVLKGIIFTSLFSFSSKNLLVMMWFLQGPVPNKDVFLKLKSH